MKLNSLMRVLLAAHYTNHVECPPKLRSRGGIMLVAPPGALKTAIIRAALDGHQGALGLSDLNVQAMGRLRHNISTGKVQTLMFYEFQKLYQRDSDVSGNLEGVISALVEEGFHKLAFDVQEAHSLPCHALVVGATVPEFYERKIGPWLHSGFARRFVWSLYRLKHRNAILDAVAGWRELAITNRLQFRIPSAEIPYSIKHDEARQIQSWLTTSHGIETPSILLQKIGSVLRWENKELKQKDDTMMVLADFATSLQEHGTQLELK